MKFASTFYITVQEVPQSPDSNSFPSHYVVAFFQRIYQPEFWPQVRIKKMVSEQCWLLPKSSKIKFKGTFSFAFLLDPFWLHLSRIF